MNDRQIDRKKRYIKPETRYFFKKLAQQIKDKKE